MDANSLTHADSEALRSLRKRGFAVVVFNPDELGSTRADDLEAGLVAHANENILESAVA